MTRPLLTTAVIGAGPAGLLFCVLGRLLHARAGGDAATWALRLYDKREAYARTHRLRMDPAPYLAMQRDVDDRRFDALVDFLREDDFTPEVNALEARLSEMLAELGVVKSRLEIGDDPEQTSLSALRAMLEGEELIGKETPFTIVGADSVHSVIRERVRAGTRQIRHTHERVARLRVLGDGLLTKLGVLDQYRLSKVLGSVVDYRLNRNGFAEVDLFLTQPEHEAVRSLGATPSEPVPISATMLAKLRAPLFRAIVSHLELGGRKVLLQSTFQLEHTIMPRLSFELTEARAHVFLVGDAGVSLPFFRGMACLGACAHSLARVHCDLLAVGNREAGATTREVAQAEIRARYDREANVIKAREIGIVASRARLVRILREVVRVSSLLPFPIQSWFLTTHGEEERARDKATIGLLANVVLAVGAGSIVVAGAVLSSDWLVWSALPVEVAGGAAYRATLSFEPGPHRLVRRVWEIQIALALLAGAGLTASASWSTGRLANPAGAIFWLLLGAAFVLGIFAYERWIASWFTRADLDGR